MQPTNNLTMCYSAPRAAALIAAATIAASSSPAWAIFQGRSEANGLTAVVSGPNPMFMLERERADDRGNHGYALTELDFRAGYLRGRNHACVGPSPATFIGNARGTNLILSFSESLTVTSDTLPFGTPVTFRLCVDMSSEITGSVTDPARAGGRSSTVMAIDLAGSLLTQGRHETGDDWSNPNGGFAGLFAGQTGEFFSERQVFTFTRTVGQTIPFGFNADSDTFASATNRGEGGIPIATGSAGFAMTFGIESITAGARLEWGGSEWTGSCGGSAALVPPNPVVPAPSTLIALSLAAATISRSRRR